MIDREDMLELTRRMTSSRTHLLRVAGAYIDEEGFIDGTFHTNFLNLKGEEKKHALEIARAIPFSETNKELVQYPVPGMARGSVWQLLYALRDCELKNDALLLTLYEWIAGQYPAGRPYAVYVYYGVYDVPVKASDKERLDESEEVYRYLILAIAPLTGDYQAGLPCCGFLYPAFSGRSTDLGHVNVYHSNRLSTKHLLKILF